VDLGAKSWPRSSAAKALSMLPRASSYRSASE
jgi:hypothetical protein